METAGNTVSEIDPVVVFVEARVAIDRQ